MEKEDPCRVIMNGDSRVESNAYSWNVQGIAC